MMDDSDTTGHKRSQSTGVYIQGAAKVVGVSPGVLRRWEAKGLVSPSRTASGYRLYRPEHIQLLHTVRNLMVGRGLNAEGALHALAVRQDPTPADDAATPGIDRRIRHLRQERGWSMRRLAELSGLSVSTISSIERGRTPPSFGSLNVLSESLGTTVSDLVAAPVPASTTLVRRDERQQLANGSGISIARLVGASPRIEGLMLTLQPGKSSGRAYSHRGEDFVYVQAGSLMVTLDDTDHYRMQEGDALTFPGYRRHAFHNVGEDDAVALWITSGHRDIDVEPRAHSPGEQTTGS